MRNYADARARGRPRAVHVSCVVWACRWSAMAGGRPRNARQRPGLW